MQKNTPIMNSKNAAKEPEHCYIMEVKKGIVDMIADLERSEEQIALGKTVNARESLQSVRKKYGL